MLVSSVADAIEATARLRPRGRAVLGLGIDIGYHQLSIDVDLASQWAASQGLTVGKRVAILMRQTYMHAVLILAFDRLGVATMSISLDETDALGKDWTKALNFDCVVAASPKPSNIDITWIELDPGIQPSAAFDISHDPKLAETLIDRDPTRVVRFVRTSGTMGNPKVVALSRELVMKRVLAHHMYCEGMGSNRHLLAMPFGTIAGYGYLLMVVCRGATFVTWSGSQPIDAVIDRFQVSHLLLAPNHLQNIASSGRELSSIAMVTTGGAPFDTRLINKARAVLGPNIWNGYTSTEAGSLARGHIGLMEQDPNTIGAVLPFVTLEIVDEDDNPVPVGQSGVIRVRSELAADQYEYGEDDDRVFRDNYVYTGDLGALDERGFLKMLGRRDNLLNIRGIKTTAENVEQKLTSIPRIQEAAAFQINAKSGVQSCAAIVLAEGQTRENLAEEITKSLGIMTPYRIEVVAELPRNSMGKILRRELENRFSKPQQSTK